MKLRIAALFISLCMLLSGCMGLEQNTESLMRPPKLSVEQQNIFAALSAAVGDEIVLKYPSGGEYRSAFVMYDIDSNGEDEVIAFYSTSADSDDLRINILDKQDGEWYSIYDEGAGLASEIDSISFLPITKTNPVNIVISFEMLPLQQKTLCVYSFVDGKLVVEFESDYSSSLIQDFDGDGLDELFLLYNVEQSMAKAMIVDTLYTGGPLTVVNEVEMNKDVKEYLQFSVEPEYDDEQQTQTDKEQQPSSYKIYIDGRTAARGNYVTELVRLKGNTLTNLLVNEEGIYYYTDWRNVALLTQDHNNDGVLDIPGGIKIPDWPNESEESPVTLIQWDNYYDEEFMSIGYTLVNRTFGFSFDYPALWGNNIAVKQTEDGYEWQMYELLDQDDLLESEEKKPLGDELLRIRVYPNDLYFDEYSSEDYTRIGSNDEYTYYAYFPKFEEGMTNELTISWDEFVALFHY
ncbi:MAG: hypothetical protein ACERKO_05025 [Acetanaerobacterium sp.]